MFSIFGEASRRLVRATMRHFGLVNPELIIAVSVTRNQYQDLTAEDATSLTKQLRKHFKELANGAVKFGTFEFGVCGYLQVRIKLACRSRAVDLTNAVRRSPELRTVVGAVNLAVKPVKEEHSFKFEKECHQRRQLDPTDSRQPYVAANERTTETNNPFLINDSTHSAPLAINTIQIGFTKKSNLVV